MNLFFQIYSTIFLYTLFSLNLQKTRQHPYKMDFHNVSLRIAGNYPELESL